MLQTAWRFAVQSALNEHSLAETGLDGTILVTGGIAAGVLALAGIVLILARRASKRG